MRFRYLHQSKVESNFPRRSRALLGAGTVALGALSLAGPLFAAPTLGGDTNGPRISILQPSYQDVLKNTTRILIAVQAQKFEPKMVELFVDDHPASRGPMPLAAFPSSNFNWDTSLFPDGPHKLTVRVTDTQGFRGWAEVFVYINNKNVVDNVAPDLSWMNIKPRQMFSGTQTITLDARDNFGVKYLIVSVNPASAPNQKPPSRAWFLNRPPYTINFDTTVLPDGLYELDATAWDAFQQEGKAPPLRFGISNAAINATPLQQQVNKWDEVESAPAATQATTNIEIPGVDVPQQARPERKHSSSEGTVAPVFPVQPGNMSVPPLVETTDPQPVLPPALVPPKPAPVKATIPPVVPPRIATNPQPVKPLAPASFSALQRVGEAVSGAAPLNLQKPAVGANARLSQPLGVNRTYVGPAQFAASNAPRVPHSVSGTAILPVEHEKIELAARPSVPQSGARPILGAPAWSEANSNVPTLVARSNEQPASESAEAIERAGRAAQPVARNRTLLAVVQDAVQGVRNALTGDSPVLSHSKIGARMAGAGHLTPQIAAPSASKGPRASRPEFAALPRFPEAANNAPKAAITVAPLEISATSAIPAFHVATQTSSVKAIALQYRLPADVVAACNGVAANASFAKGTRVKLPTPLQVSFQGQPVRSDVASLMVGSTSMTAFRFLFEQQGGTMHWDAKTHQVVARNANKQVVLTIGSRTARVDNKDVMMELAAFLLEGRTMVPVRFFEQGLQAKVEWEPETGRLFVAMAN